MDNDRNAPATKGDLADQEARIVEAIRDAQTDQEARIVEAIRDAQTEVLKAFYGFAESNRQRVAQLEGNQCAIITRIGVLEDRMLEIERKVNFPHQPRRFSAARSRTASQQ